jgi:hypothetical protein
MSTNMNGRVAEGCAGSMLYNIAHINFSTDALTLKPLVSYLSLLYGSDNQLYQMSRMG